MHCTHILLNKYTQKKPRSQGYGTLLQRGSMLVLSSFLILILTLITVSFWKLINIRLDMVNQKEQSLRSYYAARAGMEDAIYEFVQGHDWDFSSGELNQDWEYSTDQTFYKTNQTPDVLSFIEYPVTYSVTVLGDIMEDIVTLNIVGEVSKESDSAIYKTTLQAVLSRTFDGKIITHSLIELSDG